MYSHIVTIQRSFSLEHFATVARIALCLLMDCSLMFSHVANLSERFTTVFAGTDGWMFCVFNPTDMARNTAGTFVVSAIDLVRMNHLFLL